MKNALRRIALVGPTFALALIAIVATTNPPLIVAVAMLAMITMFALYWMDQEIGQLRRDLREAHQREEARLGVASRNGKTSHATTPPDGWGGGRHYGRV